MSCLARKISEPALSTTLEAQRKCYVTYTAPDPSNRPPRSITLLESPSLLACSGTTGLRTWEASKFLASFLYSPTWKAYIAGKNVMELGCGTGLISILVAKHLEAKFVLATDGSSDVVDAVAANMSLNNLDESGLIKPVVLEWGHVIHNDLLRDQNGARQYHLGLGADVVCPLIRSRTAELVD